MVQFEAIADASLKSFEYNYVIPVGQNGVSHVWEYSGLYQGAHSFGENDLSFGVIFLLGVDNFGKVNQLWQPISPEMIYGMRWLRTKLRKEGWIAPDHRFLPHQYMPEAATVCPGVPAIGAWNEMSVYVVDDPIIGVDVLKRISKPTWSSASDDLPWLGHFDSGTIRPMISNDLKPLELCPTETDGVWPIPDKGQYKRLCDWAKITIPAI